MPSDFEYPVKKFHKLFKYGDEEADINEFIVSQVMSHPKEMPSLTEIDYMADADSVVDPDSVRQHIDKLLQENAIVRFERDEYVFISLTHQCKQFLVDTKMYRTSAVMKSLGENLQRTEEVEAAFNADRPYHEPIELRYEENNVADHEEWNEAREETYRDLTLKLIKESETKVRFEVVEGDEGEVLAAETISSDNIDWEKTYAGSTVEAREPRGTVDSSTTYGIIIDRRGSSISAQIKKNGEKFFKDIAGNVTVFYD